MKIVLEKLRDKGGIWWWEEYEVLRRKFEPDNEFGSLVKLKNEIIMQEMKYIQRVYCNGIGW